jgi:hypothetical protein
VQDKAAPNAAREEPAATVKVQKPPAPVNDPNQMPTVNPNEAPGWLSDSVWNEGGANELPLFKWMRAYVCSTRLTPTALPSSNRPGRYTVQADEAPMQVCSDGVQDQAA